MLISDTIAKLIEEMLDNGNGSAELKRNDLASQIGCVPSQINYVITSRFTPERGYMTESRRGGGGYIKIVRVKLHRNEYLMHFFHAIGDSLDEQEAIAYIKNLMDNNIISDNESKLIAASICGSALDRIPPAIRNNIRADIMRHILMVLMK